MGCRCPPQPCRLATVRKAQVERARADGFVQHEALANELAAGWYERLGQAKLARPYWQDAHYLYGRWGANAKVRRLEEEHPFLAEAWADGSDGRETSAKVSADLETALKASQAISSQIRLDDLLPRLVAIATENAGAERGVLLLERDGQWYATAAAQATDAGEEAALDLRPIAQARDLPLGVVQYAIRTRETVLLHDAAHEGSFRQDPYVRSREARSLLCLPVLHQGEVRAVLYLENNLTSGAFTADHLAILSVLAGQAAISLENARVYELLDRRVHERTAELEETLATLRRAQAQMVESEKMASLGLLTAGVAHEINNPVNFLIGSVGPLRRDVEDILGLLERFERAGEALAWAGPLAEVDAARQGVDVGYAKAEIAQLLSGIEEGSRRTAEIVRGLRTFARADRGGFQRASPIEGLESTLALVREQYHPRIRIVREYGTVPEIECQPGQLNQVFMNLLTNAIQAIEGEGEIRIAADRVGDGVRIAIHDSGAGMSAEVRTRIFEPFFTTKPVGVGTGLGLSITFGIVERHGGKVEVESEPGEGTTFTLTLPLEQPAAREAGTTHA